jgi:hypothetical protein
MFMPYEINSKFCTIIIDKSWFMKFVMLFIFLMVTIGCGKTKAIILLRGRITICGIPYNLTFNFFFHILKNLSKIIIVTKVYELVMLHNIITILKNLELFLIGIYLFIYK